MNHFKTCPARASNDDARAQYRRVRTMIISGEYNFVFLELGCAPDSELCANVRECCLAVRVTVKKDLTSAVTKRALHSILRLCKLYGIEAHMWVSAPCTAGCRWQDVNSALGVPTGGLELTDRLIDAAIPLCDHVCRYDGSSAWEWPERN